MQKREGVGGHVCVCVCVCEGGRGECVVEEG